ncbi:unnamed protein product [Medioppia subpectinata]|uniref:Arrestin C-terminal-like domain-containing protein n=1 Tax=Medioppia subpectinata TaxID=1979941 RepID=A0A7R9KBM7_9ACAR|nr:unnamed protein product [Medioppia subpectinata]CAG2100439.1 unnamed protein product [Medioppia subpectinata]
MNSQLNGNKFVYRNGEQIGGICVIAFNGELDLKHVKLRLRGEAEVKWSKTKWVTSANDRQSRIITYHQILNFLTQDFDVTQTAKATKVERGVHRIAFVFHIPEDVPNSFKGNFGQIHYWIEAQIEKSLLSWNHETQTKFYLCSPLKAVNNAPIVYRRLRDYCCCFIKRGSIDVEMSINENSFNGGDSIAVSYDITNGRNFAIKMRATLVEKHIFKAHNNQKDSTEKHISTEVPFIEAGKQSTGVIRVPIPANARPSTKCPLIEAKYFVNIFIDDKSSGLEFNFPVIPFL